MRCLDTWPGLTDPGLESQTSWIMFLIHPFSIGWKVFKPLGSFVSTTSHRALFVELLFKKRHCSWKNFCLFGIFLYGASWNIYVDIITYYYGDQSIWIYIIYRLILLILTMAFHPNLKSFYPFGVLSVSMLVFLERAWAVDNLDY